MSTIATIVDLDEPEAITVGKLSIEVLKKRGFRDHFGSR